MPDEADSAYQYEQEARRQHAKAKSKLRYLLYSIWRISSGYGKNELRWLGLFLAFIVIFASLFQLEYTYGLLVASPGTWTWFSPFYYTALLLTTLGDDSIKLIGILPRITVLFTLFFGWILLAVGAEFVVRTIGGR